MVEWFKALVLKNILRLSYIKGFGNIFKTWPENESIYYYRYLAHSVLFQYEEAIEDCKKLIALEPDNESHHKNLTSLEELLRLNRRFRKLKE